MTILYGVVAIYWLVVFVGYVIFGLEPTDLTLGVAFLTLSLNFVAFAIANEERKR